MTQLARCEYIDRRENIIAIGNSGTGKTHVALGLGLAACQKGLSVSFNTAMVQDRAALDTPNAGSHDLWLLLRGENLNTAPLPPARSAQSSSPPPVF